MALLLVSVLIYLVVANQSKMIFHFKTTTLILKQNNLLIILNSNLFIFSQPI